MKNFERRNECTGLETVSRIKSHFYFTMTLANVVRFQLILFTSAFSDKLRKWTSGTCKGFLRATASIA